jgi:hypothetical protein
MPTNSTGRYLLRNLKPGQYTLDVSCIGFRSVSRQITLVAGQTFLADFVLESTTYSIGGIDVVADVELLPKEAETKTLIRSDQIEHLQASSLGDVLQLMPGVKSENPGLVSVQQANLRGSEKDPTGRTMCRLPTMPICRSTARPRRRQHAESIFAPFPRRTLKASRSSAESRRPGMGI